MAGICGVVVKGFPLVAEYLGQASFFGVARSISLLRSTHAAGPQVVSHGQWVFGGRLVCKMPGCVTSRESLRQIRELHIQAETALGRRNRERARAPARAILELDALNLSARGVLEKVGVGLETAAKTRRLLWLRSLVIAWKLMNNRVTRRFVLMIVIIWAARRVMFAAPRVRGLNPSRSCGRH